MKENPKCVAKLAEISDFTREVARRSGFNIGLSRNTPIVPIIIGNSRKCIELSRQLLQKKKISVKPIIYPAVPEEEARLRLFITSKHTKKQVLDTFKALVELYNKMT